MNNTVVTHNFPNGTVLSAEGNEYTVCARNSASAAHRMAPADAVLVEYEMHGGARAYSYLLPNEIDSVVSVPSDPKDESVNAIVNGGFNYDLANLAKDYGKVLAFQYVKSDKAPVEWRSVRPDSVYEDRHGDLLIVGPCPDRNDRIRAFRIDRIVGEATL